MYDVITNPISMVGQNAFTNPLVYTTILRLAGLFIFFRGYYYHKRWGFLYPLIIGLVVAAHLDKINNYWSKNSWTVWIIGGWFLWLLLQACCDHNYVPAARRHYRKPFRYWRLVDWIAALFTGVTWLAAQLILIKSLSVVWPNLYIVLAKWQKILYLMHAGAFLLGTLVGILALRPSTTTTITYCTSLLGAAVIFAPLKLSSLIPSSSVLHSFINVSWSNNPAFYVLLVTVAFIGANFQKNHNNKRKRMGRPKPQRFSLETFWLVERTIFLLFSLSLIALVDVFILRPVVSRSLARSYIYQTWFTTPILQNLPRHMTKHIVLPTVLPSSWFVLVLYKCLGLRLRWYEGPSRYVWLCAWGVGVAFCYAIGPLAHLAVESTVESGKLASYSPEDLQLARLLVGQAVASVRLEGLLWLAILGLDWLVECWKSWAVEKVLKRRAANRIPLPPMPPRHPVPPPAAPAPPPPPPPPVMQPVVVPQPVVPHSHERKSLWRFLGLGREKSNSSSSSSPSKMLGCNSKHSTQELLDKYNKVVAESGGVYDADEHHDLGEDESRLCVICMEKEIDTVILECGHMISCEDCSGSLGDKCPTCRTTITRVVKVYFG